MKVTGVGAWGGRVKAAHGLISDCPSAYVTHTRRQKRTRTRRHETLYVNKKHKNLNHGIHVYTESTSLASHSLASLGGRNGAVKVTGFGAWVRAVKVIGFRACVRFSC